MKRIAMVLTVIGLLIAASAAAALWQMNRFMDTAINLPVDGATINIVPGSSFAAVTGQLVAAGYIDNDFWYRLYARLSGTASAIHAGEYRVEAGATPATLLDQLMRGDVQLHSFTIVEGWNHRDLLHALQADQAIDASMTDEDWPALLEELGAAVTHPEGLFLPETYSFPLHTTDRELLTEAYRLMQTVLADEWQGRSAVTPVKTPYEALILASVVEKETARADERPRIAGVFARRLQKGMRLQTDPTVIYGIGKEFNGNLTKRDLQTDTPYNTYTRRGLPPTPIAMPGRAAIHAVLHPTAGDALYFVATGLGDGSHKFSATKAEHDKAVAAYLRRIRQRRREGH